MIQRLSEMPKVGEWIVDNNNPAMDVERLKCVAHMDDVEDPDIKYALFQSADPELNNKVENGVKFYTMRGYMDLHDGR